MENETIIDIVYFVLFLALFIGGYFAKDAIYSDPLKSENPDYA